MARIRKPEKYDAGLRAALEKAGGPSALAVAIHVVPSAITQWRRVPAERAAAVSLATGIPRHELRPDIFDAPPVDPTPDPAPTPPHAAEPTEASFNRKPATCLGRALVVAIPASIGLWGVIGGLAYWAASWMA